MCFFPRPEKTQITPTHATNEGKKLHKLTYKNVNRVNFAVVAVAYIVAVAIGIVVEFAICTLTKMARVTFLQS